MCHSRISALASARPSAPRWVPRPGRPGTRRRRDPGPAAVLRPPRSARAAGRTRERRSGCDTSACTPAAGSMAALIPSRRDRLRWPGPGTPAEEHDASTMTDSPRSLPPVAEAQGPALLHGDRDFECTAAVTGQALIRRGQEPRTPDRRDVRPRACSAPGDRVRTHSAPVGADSHGQQRCDPTHTITPRSGCPCWSKQWSRREHHRFPS